MIPRVVHTHTIFGLPCHVFSTEPRAVECSDPQSVGHSSVRQGLLRKDLTTARFWCSAHNSLAECGHSKLITGWGKQTVQAARRVCSNSQFVNGCFLKQVTSLNGSTWVEPCFPHNFSRSVPFSRNPKRRAEAPKRRRNLREDSHSSEAWAQLRQVMSGGWKDAVVLLSTESDRGLLAVDIGLRA